MFKKMGTEFIVKFAGYDQVFKIEAEPAGLEDFENVYEFMFRSAIEYYETSMTRWKGLSGSGRASMEP